MSLATDGMSYTHEWIDGDALYEFAWSNPAPAPHSEQCALVQAYDSAIALVDARV